RQLVDVGRAWFTEHPIYDAHGQPIDVPEWSFPGRGRVQRQLHRLSKMLGGVERAVSQLPIRGRQAELSARIEERKSMVDRAVGYVELYGAYAETEAVFRVDRLLDLWSTLDEEDQRSLRSIRRLSIGSPTS